MKIKTHCSCGKPLYIGQGFKVPYCLDCDMPPVNNLEAFRNHFIECGIHGELLILAAEIAGRPLTEPEMVKVTDWLSQTLLKQIKEFQKRALAALDKLKPQTSVN